MKTSKLAVLLILMAFVLSACEQPQQEETAPETTEEEAVEEETVEEETAEETAEETEEEAAEMDTVGIEAPEDVAAPPEDAERTDSGLASKVLREGTGDTHPSPTSVVTVHYSGWTTDGERFDSSVVRGQPTSFPLNQVIAGWTEGLQLMVVGEQRRFWIPEELAYQGRRPPHGMLVFDVELIEIQ